MRKLYTVFLLSGILMSCSSHDAELEKDLNNRIDNFGISTVDFCNCLGENEGDCTEEYDKANKAHDEMQKLHDIESENNLDAEVYSEMLESSSRYKTDFFTCMNIRNARKH